MADAAGQDSIPGLVGEWAGDARLTRLKGSDLVSALDLKWEGRGRGVEWSAWWGGFVKGPVTGNVTFRVETPMQAILEVGDRTVVEVGENGTSATGVVSMEKGTDTPIRVTYMHAGGRESLLRVMWEWTGVAAHMVPGAALTHTRQQELAVRYEPRTATREQIRAIDRSAFKTVAVRHYHVFREEGYFAGWPANNGIWSWGNEILVAFIVGHYKESPYGHSIDPERPARLMMGRSLDGGETWALEEPALGDGELRPCPGGIDFTHPDFAMRCQDDWFVTSHDRGKTWQGPYRLPTLGTKMTSRTDYVVMGPDECLVFLSAKDETVQAGLNDRAFCAVTQDAGATFAFRSWITGERDTARSVMPSTTRCGEDHLVSALRRRIDTERDGTDITTNWIDAVESRDRGNTWSLLGKVADTDRGHHNGNPPSLVRLRDGRLCVTYAFRAFPFGIRARLSSDDGKTWGREIHLRDDAREGDIGYTRTVQRADGNLVTIYYYTTHDAPHQSIVATVWAPPRG